MKKYKMRNKEGFNIYCCFSLEGLNQEHVKDALQP